MSLYVGAGVIGAKAITLARPPESGHSANAAQSECDDSGKAGNEWEKIGDGFRGGLSGTVAPGQRDERSWYPCQIRGSSTGSTAGTTRAWI